MKKRYKLDYDWKAEMVVEIDHSLITEEDLHNINKFWSNADGRLMEEEGNILNVVLKMLFQHLLMLQIETGWATHGLIDRFDWDKGHGQEGWTKMDGSTGIQLIDIDEFSFETSDMTIKEEES